MAYQKHLSLRGGNIFIDARFIECNQDDGYFGFSFRGIDQLGDHDIRDSVELRIYPHKEKISFGSVERQYRPRPEDPLRVEFAIYFNEGRLRLTYGRDTLLNEPIRYIRPSEQELVIVMNQARVQIDRLIAGVATTPPHPTAEYQPIEITPKFKPLRSSFLSYFGTHYSGADDFGIRFKAVRSYGGTHVSLTRPPDDVYVTERIGPFSGSPVHVRLEDYHSQSKFARNPKSGPELFKDIVGHGMTTLSVMPTGPVFEDQPYDRDFAYWFYRLAHEQYPTLNQHAVWQIGNEIVSAHWNPKRLNKHKIVRFWNADHTQWNGYDLQWKLDFYVNQWLGPEIESIQAAARDVYGDPHAIPVAAGSVNPYNKPNIWFLKQLMDSTFDPRLVPTLGNEPVWKHIDYLTIHYMLAPPDHANRQRLDQFTQDYLRTNKVRGIWITEEHGVRGRGATTVLERGMYFLRWVVDNHLSADQAKVFWYGESNRDGRGDGVQLMAKLGQFWGPRQIDFGTAETNDAYFQVMVGRSDAEQSPDRLLIAILPKNKAELSAGEITIHASSLTGPWQAEGVDYSPITEPTFFDVGVMADKSALNIECNRVLLNPTVIYLTRPR